METTFQFLKILKADIKNEDIVYELLKEKLMQFEY